MQSITYQQTLEAMKAAVEEKGADYVYERQPHPTIDSPGSVGTCLNTSVDGKEPGCLVGNALHRLGVPLEWLASKENINSSSGGLVSKLMHENMFAFDHESVRLMAEAQSLQDNSTPWGEALKKAEKYALDGVHSH